MTFKQAYKYAMEHSEIFRMHDSIVKDAQNNETTSPCLIFSIGSSGETFYYYFDGVDLMKGKHPKKRAIQLINSYSALIIR